MSDFMGPPEEAELSAYIDGISSELEASASAKLHGDGTYVGMAMLRRFYRGNQWLSKKEGGGAMRVFNYCFTVVENMTAFGANEAPEFISVPRDTSDEIERARSEGIFKALSEIHRQNRLPTTFQRMVRCGSLNGESFIFGPVWDPGAGAIRYWNIEKPESIRIIWADDNHSEMVGFINRYRTDPRRFAKRYRAQLEERGISIDDVVGMASELPAEPAKRASADGPSYSLVSGAGSRKMLDVQEYLDDEYRMVRLVGQDGRGTVVDFFRHGYGFVPGISIPNIHIPGEAGGTSDIENILDPQIAYNESKSNEEDILRQVAFTSLWGKNLENFSVIESGIGSMYSFNAEAEINAIPRSTNPMMLEQYQRDIKGDVVDLSGQNPALYPGGARSVLASTGRALSVLMQGVNNKVALRKVFWKEALETLNANILSLAQEKVPGARELIDGNFRTEVFIASVLLRDVTEEINKFNSKLQSMATTMKNLGIPSPTEEQKTIVAELKDPVIGVELSRQPALLQQVLAQILQRQSAPAEAGSEQNPEMAIMEEQGAGSPMPAATPMQRGPSRSTPEGAVAAAGQRSTGVPLAKKKA